MRTQKKWFMCSAQSVVGKFNKNIVSLDTFLYMLRAVVSDI